MLKKVDNAKPKIDNKAPILNIGAYYQIGKIEQNAMQLAKIEDENFKLIRNINILNRTKGKTDCYKPVSMDNKTNNFESIILRNRKIYRDNIELLSKIVNAKSQISTDELLKHQREHSKRLKFLSKYSKNYGKSKMREIDPLISKITIPKDIQIKNSRIFMDIQDLSINKMIGRINIILYDSIVPITVQKFKKLYFEHAKYSYNVTQIFRIVPDLFCLGGNIQFLNGFEGLSFHDNNFTDENYVLSHCLPGVLSMYNIEENLNNSQFLITFKPLKTLDGHNVVFGRITNGLRILRMIENLGLPSGKTKHKVIIKRCGILKDNMEN
ncbi:uncharacterized protein LOC126896718 [Daktulosphaira vitifoliae]|uniref:uncharacterized protein LOC126896718 n=1 Tax=Daktulosphaira vitifoliae TaxID=58002 RepID=UPI0021AA9955|nr:uncharacterized protein LOC126896718 [Daktulosphaira vitifoliae]